MPNKTANNHFALSDGLVAALLVHRDAGESLTIIAKNATSNNFTAYIWNSDYKTTT
jgi:hypothetical protein